MTHTQHLKRNQSKSSIHQNIKLKLTFVSYKINQFNYFFEILLCICGFIITTEILFENNVIKSIS